MLFGRIEKKKFSLIVVKFENKRKLKSLKIEKRSRKKRNGTKIEC